MSRRQPRLHELDAIRVLLQAGSTTETARRLGISQPAVSKALRQAEDAFGFALFQRLNGRLHLTPEAEALGPAVAAVFGSLRGLDSAAAAIRLGQAAPVTLAAIPTLANVVLPAAIQAARLSNPGLRVSLQVLPTRPVVEAVARGEVDVGLVHDILDDPLVQAEDLGAVGIACIVPQGHALAGSSAMRVQDLRGHPLVSYPAQSPVGARIGAAFEAQGETFLPTIEMGASTALCAVALQSGMVGLVEDYVLALGWWPDLQPIPLVPGIPLRLRLLTPTQRPIPRAAQDLAQHCRDVAATAAWCRSGPET